MTAELAAEILVIALCLAAGGVLKGATGAGAPVLAVPALAAFFDVRFAVIVMLLPNLLTNSWQLWRFRDQLPGRGLMLPLLGGGVVGILLGTWALTSLPSDALSLVVAFAVLAYVTLRVARPHWGLSMEQGSRLAFPAGIVAGVLQGSAGISAPVSITFLNALRMGRERFIAAISSLFAMFTVIQIPAIAFSGMLEPVHLLYGTLALAAVSAGMPAGAAIARRVSAQTLDRVILGLLCLIAVKLVFDAVT